MGYDVGGEPKLQNPTQALSPKVRRRGIEPRPSAWKADILTTELRALLDGISQAETS